MSPVDLRATAGPFQGSIVALPTPFMDGGLDVRSVSRLVEFHARFGSDALLLGGAFCSVEVESYFRPIQQLFKGD